MALPLSPRMECRCAAPSSGAKHGPILRPKVQLVFTLKSSCKNTYKAVEVTSPRKLNLLTRPVPEPGPGQVRVRVEAAGICHSDVATVEAVFPGIRYPRVPGH